MAGFAKNTFMYKILIFSILIVSFCGISRADKRTNRLYELYNSTSTSANHKRILKHFIDKKERFEKMRATMSAERQRVLSAPTAIKTTGISSIAPSAADSAFKLGEVYCFPNPAKKTNPTFHIEVGIADKVQLYIYDVSGSLIHETIVNGLPQIIDDGQGSQYAYEYTWDAKNAGSGVYIFSMTAKKGDKTLKKTGRCAVIK